MMGYEQAPAAIVYLKSSGMTKPSQLEGKTLGAAASDGTFKLFPAFAQHAGIDANKVKIKYIDPKLRESLLAKHEVDAIVGQVFNSILQLKADGVPEDQVSAFLYHDYGLDLYGNGVAASPAFLKAHPDAVKGFIRATIKGFREMAKDPKLAVAMTMKFEPLLNAQIEKDRLALAMKCCIVTPNVLKNGFGDVDEARLKRGIALVAKSDGLPRVPKAKEIFDPSFLPPQKDRMLN
jgi:NitT/TauT family transport system substrate-binding protein